MWYRLELRSEEHRFVIVQLHGKHGFLLLAPFYYATLDNQMFARYTVDGLVVKYSFVCQVGRYRYE